MKTLFAVASFTDNKNNVCFHFAKFETEPSTVS